MKFRVHVKKRIKECDGGCVGDFAPQQGEMTPMGMGPVTPVGGPDRWDNIFGYPQSNKRKKFKAKRRRK